ncbi:hypothetical protein [Streptomyces sp. cg35]|uniref:hypothetical protein n=1 Tax=Streptomyces sp. cg35 TaxID=3421650 RepID=UPI003D1677C5
MSLATEPRTSALTPSQEQRLLDQHIDPDHVAWWHPRRGVDDGLMRAWRGISLMGLPYAQPGLEPEDAAWVEDMPCETLYVLGHDLPTDQVLAAVAAHAAWGHQQPQQLRDLGPTDLVEGWADILRHRRYGCGDPAGCPDMEAVSILDADPGDYLVVPVTRIHRPETHSAPEAAWSSSLQ